MTVTATNSQGVLTLIQIVQKLLPLHVKQTPIVLLGTLASIRYFHISEELRKLSSDGIIISIDPSKKLGSV